MARPTELQRMAMKPSKWVTFWRTFWPYQLVRLLIINVRMIRVVRRSHPNHARAPRRAAVMAPAGPSEKSPEGRLPGVYQPP